MNDLTEIYTTGLKKLESARSKASGRLQAKVVVDNTFIEKAAILKVWPELLEEFEPDGRDSNGMSESIADAYDRLRTHYLYAALHSLDASLEYLQHPQRALVGMHYADYEALLPVEGQPLEREQWEKLCRSYLYHWLCHDAVLRWAAYGAAGYDQHRAFRELTGYDLELSFAEEYQQIEELLGRLLVQPFLETHFHELPGTA